MATAAYKVWVKTGRPWHVANIVKDYLQQLHAAGWRFDELGTIGDEAHLQAERPQDHTPFSETGWPGTHPYPAILALDVMAAGHDDPHVDDLVYHWLNAARAGSTPWVKYINWQGYQFDVRKGWAARPIAGHFDHAHISFRTDWADRSVDGWPVVPHGGNAMDVNERNTHLADTWRALATLTGTDAVYHLEGEAEPRHEVNEPFRVLKGIQADVAAIKAAGGSAVDPVALADALAGNEAFVNAIVVALVREVGLMVSPKDIALGIGHALVKGAEG